MCYSYRRYFSFASVVIVGLGTAAGCLGSAVAAQPADYVFAIDPSRSSLSVNVDIVGLLGTIDSDSASSTASGVMDATLTPGFEPFGMARINAFDVTLDEQVLLDFSIPFVGALSAVGVDLGLTLDPSDAGPAAAVAGDGTFYQIDNSANGTGAIQTSGVVSDTVDLADETFLLDLPGTITSSLNALTLSVPLSVSLSLDVVTGVRADVSITGTIVGTAPNSSLSGDYDGNGFVSQSDLDLVLLNWGDLVLPQGFNPAALPGPFDELVSQNELDGVLLNWGSTGAPQLSAVPEPGSWALLLVLNAGVLLYRRTAPRPAAS